MDEYIKLKQEEERSVRELLDQIGYNRQRFVLTFHKEPEAVTISMEDDIAFTKYLLDMGTSSMRGIEKKPKVYGMKILRSPDLESGEFYLSPHHLL